MEDQKIAMQFDLKKLQSWLSAFNPYFVAVRPPAVFVDMGFPIEAVKRCINTYRPLYLNDGTIGDGSGVIDGDMLVILGENIGVNMFEVNKFLSLSNRMQTLREACIARLEEFRIK